MANKPRTKAALAAEAAAADTTTTEQAADISAAPEDIAKLEQLADGNEQLATQAEGFIEPTISRKVWYWPTDFQRRTGLVAHGDQPCDATVIYVHPQGRVNLRVTDHSGNSHIAHGVELLQGVHPERNAPELEGFASWMPYQAKQAAKAAKAAA